MKFKYIKTILLIALSAGVITTSSICTDKVNAETTSPAVQQNETVSTIAPLSIVNNPKTYINKNIVMNATFDKFSTLGLDYKPAFRSSDNYISFLIKRDDTSFNIPLSEMKLFLKRSKAEKFIDLKAGDKIQIKGMVFSDALGDAWVEVEELTVTQKAPDEKK